MIATTSALSNPVAWVSSFVGLAVALSRAASFRRRTGRNPWGMHPALWALIGFAIGLIGALLALLATRRAAVQKALGAPAAPGWPPSAGTVPAPWAPGATTPPGGPPGATAAAPPGWYPAPHDPGRRGYWDGAAWSSKLRWDGASWVPDG